MKRFKALIKDKKFLRKAFIIATPVALQNLLNNLLNFIDTLMIGKLGVAQVAGVGLANKVFFVYSLLLFGICSGSSILAAQYWGKREFMNIRRVLRMSLIIGVGASFLFLLAGYLTPDIVMRIFTPKEKTIAYGTVYLGIIALSYPLTAVTIAYVTILRSMSYVKVPLIITSIAIGINIFLNYGLIFGKFGLPVMGVAGAAFATLISRILEVSMLLIIIHCKKAGDDGVGDFIHLKYKDNGNKEKFFTKEFLLKYFRTVSPVIANEFMWGLGVTMYSLVYGRMEEEAIAAITISNTIEQVALVFYFGICSAAAVILGNELGADELEKAEDHAKKFFTLQFILTLIGASLVLLLKENIIQIFNVSHVVANYIRLCLTVFALYMPIRMLNALIIVAILRCGGDTTAALILDVTGVWLIGIPMAVIGGLVFKLPIYMVYGMISLEEIYKLIFGLIRYRKKKWLRNIVAS